MIIQTRISKMIQWQRIKITNSGRHNTTQKTKDWETRTPIKHRGKVTSPGRVESSFFSGDTRRVTLVNMRWFVMNDERTELWLRRLKHILGHLKHKYSVPVNQHTRSPLNFKSDNLRICSVDSLLATKRYRGTTSAGISSRYILRMQILLECCYI